MRRRTGYPEMSSMSSAPTYIIPHIPKTAGTSLRDMLRGRMILTSPSSLGHWNLAHALPTIHPYERRFEALSELDSRQRRKVRLVYHHGGFGMHECFEQPCVYLTVVREPINRAISAYYYMRKLYAAEGTSFDDSLEEMITGGKFYDPFYYDNLQVRLLAANDRTRDAMGGAPCTPETLEMAKRNVEKFVPVVGLTEQFDAYVLLLAKHFGWNFPYYASMNINKAPERREKPSAELLDVLRERNSFDLEFYEWMQQRFAEQIAAYGDTFEHDLERFRWRNRFYDRCVGSVLRLGRLAKQAVSKHPAAE